MLNETASSIEDRPAARTSLRPIQSDTTPLQDEIRQMVMSVFIIEREVFASDAAQSDPVPRRNLLLNPDSRLTAIFEGRLIMDSEAAYEKLDAQFTTIDHIPLFRQEKDKQLIYAVQGRVNPRPRPIWLNVVLFIATVISVLMLGTNMAINEIASNPEVSDAVIEGLINNFLLEMWRGLPYAISILLILGAHELGHYFAARRHKLAVTLPYFIPAPPFIIPSPLGTFGAFIQLREPMKNRKVLLDVGAAGPFAGLIFAIPILFIGLATSQTGEIHVGGLVEGNSIFYALSKIIVFGQFLPAGGQDVYLNQVAWAGWVGLLVTALNLIPIGQLDGGHILYSLVGDWARRLYFPFIGGVILLTILFSDAWLFWLILLLLFGRVYATPLDAITPLNRRRKVWAVVGLIVFAVTFVPVPFTIVESVAESIPRESALLPSSWLMYTVIGLVVLWTSRRSRISKV
jgi:Zn-dependent protease